MPAVNKQAAKGPSKSKSQSVVDRISPIGFDENEGISINLYGRSGTGKTTLWATFPKPILAIVCSGGMRPGELRSINTPEYRKTIRTVAIQKPEEILELCDHAEGKYATVVLDHASGLQDKVLAAILDLGELPAQRSWGLASQQQYGQCTLQCKELLRRLLNLSCNRVIVAQERDFNNDNGNSEILMPYVASALSPSLTGWLNAAVDYIGQTLIRPKMVEQKATIGGKVKTVLVKTKAKEYCLRTAPDEVYTTKFRAPKGLTIPDVIVDPDYDKLMAVINGEG